MEATIIPFPGTPTARQTAATPEGQERLTRAMTDLRAALEEQRRVLGEWRFAMSELSIGVVGLGYTLEGYQQSLDEVQGKLGVLREEGARLEAWANEAEATKAVG